MASEVTPVTASIVPAQADTTLSPAAMAALRLGVPASTGIAYGRDWDDFKDWCAAVGRTALPATAETLTEYATHMAYGDKPRSPASIERSRSAIRKAHRAESLDPPDSLGLATVVKGYRAVLAEAKDPRAKPRRASAATKKPLAAMLSRLDRDTLAGRRDAALVLVGFAVAGRRSELAALDIADVAETDEGVTISLYRRKTRTHQEVAVLRGSDASLCPVLALKEWLEFLASQGRTSGPLFVRIDRHGHLGPKTTRAGKPIGDPAGRMTAEAISDVIGRKALAAALAGRWTGHSVRRGFATESRRAGHDQLRIARHGGWADHSPVLAGYIEDADQWDDNALKGVL